MQKFEFDTVNEVMHVMLHCLAMLVEDYREDHLGERGHSVCNGMMACQNCGAREATLKKRSASSAMLSSIVSRYEKSTLSGAGLTGGGHQHRSSEAYTRQGT
jgi:hypothetical protein